jgi:hypothetical protein
MVEELDAKGLRYTFTMLSKNNAKLMQQPDDDGLGSRPLMSGSIIFYFLDIYYVPRFPEEYKFG